MNEAAFVLRILNVYQLDLAKILTIYTHVSPSLL